MEVSIRAWKREDAAALAELLNDERILNNLRDGLPYPYTKRDAEEYIDSVFQADLPVCVRTHGYPADLCRTVCL